MTKGVKRDLCKKRLLPDIRDLDPWKLSSLHLQKEVMNVSLFAISNEIGHPLYLCKDIGLHLGVTPGHDQERSGVGSQSPSDHLS
jgi:hypothetical protein